MKTPVIWSMSSDWMAPIGISPGATATWRAIFTSTSMATMKLAMSSICTSGQAALITSIMTLNSACPCSLRRARTSHWRLRRQTNTSCTRITPSPSPPKARRRCVSTTGMDSRRTMSTARRSRNLTWMKTASASLASAIGTWASTRSTPWRPSTGRIGSTANR